MNVDFSKPLYIQSSKTGSGGGVVNCQKGMEDTGKFNIKAQSDGTVTIESVKYPGVYLRMDGSGIRSFAGAGAGNFLFCNSSLM
ncbi:fibroblast growth factor [Parabacteroides chinchillae]|uniref:Uncharacterized protein n=1 Tax=Parabacteroides chinchillae TaxID=871327 RepID=A0A8G2F415_9BACT|nr:hypothetical protein [Parabacteroides chinchillae]SEF52922.1 hypothetical protein SAMN05444001_102101 [Parabacteroides chinchillae]